MSRRLAVSLITVWAAVSICSAHVGSPDAWFRGSAGPYSILVHVQAPRVIPGIAQVNVQINASDVPRITAVANRFDATGGAPPPDVAVPIEGRPNWYQAPLWIMTSGSYSVTVTVSGAAGAGSAVVPIAAAPIGRLEFGPALAGMLLAIGTLLFAGLLTIARAAAREGALPPGMQPDAAREAFARKVVLRFAFALVLVVVGAWRWWAVEDAAFERTLIRPTRTAATIESTGSARLILSVIDSSWLKQGQFWQAAYGGARQSGLIEDHGKLMHMFVIDRSGGQAFAHVHPQTTDTTRFEAALPPLPAGKYNVFGDVVHATGYVQTLLATLDIGAAQKVGVQNSGAQNSGKLDADDSWAVRVASPSARATLEDGSVMTWLGAESKPKAGAEARLRFAVMPPTATAPPLEPYMGMAGHAVVIRDDAGVFVHLHPLGTISMAAQARLSGSRIADRGSENSTAGSARLHSDHSAQSDTVYFPYAFPEPGRYTVWVQVKRGGRVLTGGFDAVVN